LSAQFRGWTISRTWKTTVAANTRRSGTTTESKVAKILFDLSEDAVMSSLDESSMTKRMAINAPPTPPLITVVIDTALDAALDVSDEVTITMLISFSL
jgi:hypothetical protein